MPCVKAGPVIVCHGSNYYIRDPRGKVWFFEMHNMCGPSVLKKNGCDPIKNQPGAHSPFWEAIQKWCLQGAKVVKGEDGKKWAQYT